MRNPKISALFCPILMTAVLLLSAGCGSESVPAGGPEATSPPPVRPLRISNGTEPPDLDPQITTGSPEINIILSLFEGLVARDPATLAIVPALAESWEISEDTLTYTFHLRNDAKWSNGEPLTADDIYYSWQRLLHPDIASENAYHYYPIINAEEYNKGTLTDFSQVGIEVQGDSLTFRLREPAPLFIEWLAKQTAYPVHRRTIEAHGKISDRGTAWTRAGNMVSNGPFLLEEWTTNKIVRVRKNPYYWDRDRVKLEEIHFLPIESMTTEERMFRDGQIDMTLSGYIPPEKIEWYRQNLPEQMFINPVYITYFYMLNTTVKPLDDVRVRRALALSIDRQAIVDNVTKGGQIPAYALNPTNPDGYTPDTFLAYDIAEAKRLLAA